MTSSQMGEAAAVTRFALAGNATFTLVSRKTGDRLTFRVRGPRARDHRGGHPSDVLFVSVLVGQNNENDFSFLGTIFPPLKLLGRTIPTAFRRSPKSKIGEAAPSARTFEWFWTALTRREVVPATVEFWHEGRCGRCGRKLTVPESIRTGLGPECEKAGR